MNKNLKNVLLFIKDATELKNKNIYSIDDYEMNLDFGEFYNKFKELIECPNYSNLNINSDGIIFKIKYIKEENKKKIPEIPHSLKKYISLDNDNIVPLIEEFEKELTNCGLLQIYKDFEQNFKKIKDYNNLINLYNSRYLQFYNIYKRINDYEEKIEIIYGQNLLVWKDKFQNKIKRYILEANLEISVDPVNNIISLSIDNNKSKGFVTDFLNIESYKIKDNNLLNEFVKKINNNIITNENNLSDEIEKYINYASLENEIINREINDFETLEINKTYLFNNSGIIIRNKNIKLWIEDLEKIISMCDNTSFTSPILNLFEVDFGKEEQVRELLDDKTYNETKKQEVLFPLPSNDEQYKIVDKTKESNIVLVQGPPGTGKSHTIANLISHYISEGKKVIVTSEKAKALEVLREKLPEEIRSLSLALLTDKGVDKDLEYSIETVLKHQEDDNELKKTQSNINSLEEKLSLIQQDKNIVINKIITLMSRDITSHKEKLKNIIEINDTSNLTLMDIAIWLDKNQAYKIIPINDIENYSYVNAKEFFEKLDNIVEDIKNNHYAISSSIPINEYLNNNEIELYIKECLRFNNYKIHIPVLINSIKQSSINQSIIGELQKNIKHLSCLYQFFDKEWIKSNTKYLVFMNKVKEIKNLIESNKDFIIKVEENLYEFSINIQNNADKEKLKNIIESILDLYDEKDKISLLRKSKFNSYIKKLIGLSYNNKTISKENVAKKDLILIKDCLNYYILIENIKSKIIQVLNVDLFEKLNIQINQFGKFKDNIINILDALINYEEFTNLIDNNLNTIINTNLFSISYINCTEEYINDVLEDLKYYITDRLSLNKSNSIVNNLREFYKDYNLQYLDRMLINIEANQLDDFISSKNMLLHEITIINQYNNLKNTYSNLVREKQNLISNYIYNFSIDERNYLKVNIDKIFKFHYIEKYYLSLEKNELELSSLFEERKNIIEYEKSIISKLITLKGWYYQNRNMNSNIGTSLNRWLQLKKKLGSGKGKNTNIYLRQMREEMNIAKNAIPVWIMPLDKMIEQYPFNNNPIFDILIMDESSQSSIFSISALTRANKIIIVGDDKQISPTNVFTSIEATNDLRAKYLKNNPWNLQISRDTSIYDIIQTVCGNKKIRLTEHFRCLPEIINYSNKEFYNMEINPLKVRSKINTIEKPIKTIYVHDARIQKNSNQLYNQAEIDRIILLLGEISNDNQYDNKSIGIIVLQNSNKYIQKLREITMQKFGENFINERKIKIGTTYEFQGDERDVIIIGMVVSTTLENGEKYNFKALTTKEFDKSFNVAASRAKEQMILVHSVTLDELSTSCNRYKLLNYCLNYDKIEEKAYTKLFESNFEKDIYDYFITQNYKLIPHYKIGKYKIDFLLNNNNNQNIAIECDGDIYREVQELEFELEKQSILERCGWKFLRIRASEFYYNREETTKKIINIIENYLSNNNTNIHKRNINIKLDNMNEQNKIEIINEIDYFPNSIFIEKPLKTIEINNNILHFESNQFNYMVLYSNGISKKEISEYYNIDYQKIIESLQEICKKYNVSNIDECTDSFIKQYSDSEKYKEIYQNYFKWHSLKKINENSNDIILTNNKTSDSILKISDEEIAKNINDAIKQNKLIEIICCQDDEKLIVQPLACIKFGGTNYLRAKDKKENSLKNIEYNQIKKINLL